MFLFLIFTSKNTVDFLSFTVLRLKFTTVLNAILVQLLEALNLDPAWELPSLRPLISCP